MGTREIGIFKIAHTVVDRAEVQRWLDFIGANEFEIPDTEVVSNPALLIALAGKRCYMSFQKSLNPNLTRIRQDYVEYFDNILASGHGSVLEHAVFSFAIENVSRVFTGEMNRHRAGWAISEGSMRFIRFDGDIDYWLPTSISPSDTDDADLAERKRRSREIFERVFTNTAAEYRELLDVWNMDDTHKNFSEKKKVTSCLRRIVPMGVATGGVWTGNIRAIRHVMAMRCAPVAEEEILHVFSRITKLMRDNEPRLFGDFVQDENGFWRPEYWKV